MKYWIVLMLLPLVGAWLFADGAWLFADTDLDETDNAQLKALRDLHTNERMVRRYSDLAQAIREKLADDAQDGLSVSDIQQLLSQRNLEDEINKAGLNLGDLLRIRPVKPDVKPPGETDEEDDDDNCIAQLDDEVFADLSEAFVQLKDRLQLVEEIFATLKHTVSEDAVDELMSLEGDIKAIAAEAEAKIIGAKGETMEAADVETERIEGEALEAAEVLIDRIEGVALGIAGSIVEKRKRLRCRVKSCTSNCYCRLIGCTTCKAKTIGWWWTKRKVHRCDV